MMEQYRIKLEKEIENADQEYEDALKQAEELQKVLAEKFDPYHLFKRGISKKYGEVRGLQRALRLFNESPQSTS